MPETIVTDADEAFAIRRTRIPEWLRLSDKEPKKPAPPPGRTKISPATRDQVNAMYDEGFEPREIAAELLLSRQQVHSIIVNAR